MTPLADHGLSSVYSTYPMQQPIDIKAALRHFKRADPQMAVLLSASLASKTPIILPTPKSSDEFFRLIIRSIVSQQISVKAAAAIFARLEALLGEITPDAVLKTSDEDLRACGLSGPKVRYLKTNAAIWHEVPVASFATLSDEDVIAELIKLHGIGRWTAEMFLMFSLARPDVFSYGDLGLMQGLYEHYGYRPHWKRKIKLTVESWAPHRTVAALALWHRKDNGPVVL